MHSNPALPMAENARRVLSWAEEVGYVVYYLKEHRRLEDPGEIAHRGRCHLLLQSREEPYPAVLSGIEQSAAVRWPAPGSRRPRVPSADACAPT